VIGHPIHRVATEAEPGDPGQAGASHVMWRRPLELVLGDGLAQQVARLVLPLFPTAQQQLSIRAAPAGRLETVRLQFSSA